MRLRVALTCSMIVRRWDTLHVICLRLASKRSLHQQIANFLIYFMYNSTKLSVSPAFLVMKDLLLACWRFAVFGQIIQISHVQDLS